MKDAQHRHWPKRREPPCWNGVLREPEFPCSGYRTSDPAMRAYPPPLHQPVVTRRHYLIDTFHLTVCFVSRRTTSRFIGFVNCGRSQYHRNTWSINPLSARTKTSMAALLWPDKWTFFLQCWDLPYYRIQRRFFAGTEQTTQRPNRIPDT